MKGVVFMNNNFKLIKEEYCQEVHGLLGQYEHIKTKAKVVTIKNEDKNKGFVIGFNTLPSDDSGVAHILEHSVLNGSKHYPIKKPFVELIKGSLNTFLNAMTFKDKTMYPVASMNEKDYFNLMNVYLDAVFYPRIYDIEEIVHQEGGMYLLDDKSDTLKFSGVVYNEMKGALSSPDSLLSNLVYQSLYDNTYKYVSGGDPVSILNITNQQVCEFHKTYYHPSNSLTVIYGDVDLERSFNQLESYFNEFDYQEVDDKPSFVLPHTTRNYLEGEYNITDSEELENNTYHALTYVISQSYDEKTALAMQLLDFILMGTDKSPLYKALLDASLGQVIRSSYNNLIRQPAYSIILSKSNEDVKEKFEQVVYDTLYDLAYNGIDLELKEAVLAKQEFLLKENSDSGYPRALYNFLSMMSHFNYVEDYTRALYYNETLDEIKSQLDNNLFEDLIKEYLLNNSFSSLVTMKPVKGLLNKNNEAHEKFLKTKHEALSTDEIEEIIVKTKKLKEYQAYVDSEEDLKCLPVLDYEDLEMEVEHFVLNEDKVDQFDCLYHDIKTNDISYANLRFKIDHLSKDQLKPAALMTYLLGRIQTTNYSEQKLTNALLKNFGRFSCQIETVGINNSDEFIPFATISYSYLNERNMIGASLVEEIIMNTDFKAAKNRIKQTLGTLASQLKNDALNGGFSTAIQTLTSYFSKTSSFNQEFSGLEYANYIEDLYKNFDDKFDDFIKQVDILLPLIFTKNNLSLVFTGPSEAYELFKSTIAPITTNLSECITKPIVYEFEAQNKNQAYINSSNVNYAAIGYDFKKLGYEYHGSMMVLQTILHSDYLWNQVREQGGAYGCRIAINQNGKFIIGSYRDPHLKRTYEVYEKIVSYLENFNVSDREMLKYIIGTISDNYPPLVNPSDKTRVALSDYYNKRTQQDLQTDYNNLKATTAQDIKAYAGMLKAILNENYICCVGSEASIKKHEQLFKEVITVK